MVFFPVLHKGDCLTGSNSGRKHLLYAFAAEEHQFWDQFWDQAASSLLKSSGDAGFVSPEASRCHRALALCPSRTRGLCSQHQTQISAELLNSFLFTWPVLKEE